MAAGPAITPRNQSSAGGIQYLNSGVGYENYGNNGGLNYINPTATYQNPQAYNPTETSNGSVNYGTTTSGTPSGGGLLSGLSSLLGSNLGSLAEYGGLYSLISGQAQNAENQNNQLAGQIAGIGAPEVGSAHDILSSYNAGQLTGPYKAELTAAEGNNQDVATTASQRSAQLLANSGGGQNVQSALASQQEQIQQAQATANNNAVSAAFQNELTGSNSLLSAGGGYVQAGITQEIQSNTQLQQQLSQLMASLASAYAQQVSGNKSSSSGSGKSSGSGGGGSGGGGSGGGGGGGNAVGGNTYGNHPENGYTYSTPYSQPNGINGNYGYYTGGGDPFSYLGFTEY